VDDRSERESDRTVICVSRRPPRNRSARANQLRHSEIKQLTLCRTCGLCARPPKHPKWDHKLRSLLLAGIQWKQQEVTSAPETANAPGYPYGRRPAQHNLEPQVDCREPLSEEFYLQKPAPVLGLSFHLRSSAPGLQVSPFY